MRAAWESAVTAGLFSKAPGLGLEDFSEQAEMGATQEDQTTFKEATVLLASCSQPCFKGNFISIPTKVIL